MQELNYGRIEDLAIRSGEPILDPTPRVVRHIKLGGDNSPRPELKHSDFALKAQLVELFELFAQIENGRIETLEVQSGLPFRLVVEQSV